MRSGVWLEGGSGRADRECDQDDQTRGQQGGCAEVQAAVSSWLEPRMAEGGLQVRGCKVSGALEDRDAGSHRPAGGGPCLHSCAGCCAGCLLSASEAVSVLTSVGSWATWQVLLNILHLMSQLGQLAPASSPLPNATWGLQQVPLTTTCPGGCRTKLEDRHVQDPQSRRHSES